MTQEENNQDINESGSAEVVAPAEDAPAMPARRKRSPWRWVMPLLSLAAFVSLVFIIRGKLREEVWAYFTDDQGVRIEVQEGKARSVLWQDPKQALFEEKRLRNAPGMLDPVNQHTRRMAAAFSPDGTQMILTRWSGDMELDRDLREKKQASARADLYLSTWDGRRWSRPQPMRDLNSEANEMEAAFSRDGKFLYFTSDREGGKGGLDLYVARWNGRKWTGVQAVAGDMNTAANESAPAVAMDDSRLYFSRDEGGKPDIYFAAITRPGEAETANEPPEKQTPKRQSGKKKKELKISLERPLPPLLPLATMPEYALAVAVTQLNSKAADVHAALTGRGDHVFLASDRDRNEAAGFGLYLARVIDGKPTKPEPVDVYINKGNLTAPVTRMQGFDLLFAGDHEQQGAELAMADGVEDGYKLYQSTTREVIGYTDRSRWHMFKKMIRDMGWWIVAMLAAILGLIYILEKWQDITSLYHKCLAGSVAAHLLLLLLLALWQLSQLEPPGAELQSPEIAIHINALAQEELALESNPDIVEVAESPAPVVSKLQSDFKIPVAKPVENIDVTPVVTQTANVSLVNDVRLTKASESAMSELIPEPQQQLEMPLLAALPEMVLPTPDQPVLEEADFSEVEKPVDTTLDEFKPDLAVAQQVETRKSDVTEMVKSAMQALATNADAVTKSQVAVKTRDTGGELVLARAGLEAIGQLPELDGAGLEASLLTGQLGSASAENPALPGELSVPDNANLEGKALTKLIQKQRGKPSTEVVTQMGGSEATEKAIGQGLAWLTQVQEPEGYWDMAKFGSQKKNVETGGVGLALLCYYGWGIKHHDEGNLAGAAQKALNWLLKQQKEDGDLRGGGDMYCHGIAAIALCEAYGLTKDEKLLEPATKSIAFILKAQSKRMGGWRYSPGEHGSDTSVTGWQYMAMHSARMAGIEIPDEPFVMVDRYLSSVATGKQKGLYGYSNPSTVRPAMVATGMFCRQLDLIPPTDPRMQEGAEYIKNHPVSKHKDYYYIYYATLALYQHQGPIWEQWNKDMKEFLLLQQKKNGPEQGSWDAGGGHGSKGGRVVSTTMAILSLEVYYRLLPMYGFRQ